MNVNGVFGKFLHAICVVVVTCAFVAGATGAAVAACATNEIDALGDGTQCKTTKFSVTTTSDATTLSWTMTAKGPFYADCGDGGTLTQSGTTTGSTISGNTITRTGTSNTTYTCTWGSAGVHTVRFGGTATGYSTSTTAAAIAFYKSSGGTQSKVASISGSLGAMFPVVNGNIPRFYQTFYNCTNLTSIPANLFSGLNTSSVSNTSYMFRYTFYGCSSLTSIPADLFSAIDTSSATNISSMFVGTFYNCSSLTSLPAGLFSTIDTSSATNISSMFNGTFRNCTSLGSIPAGLFSTIDTSSATNISSMFSDTFYNCSSLTSIPADLFSTIDISSATNTTYMFRHTFRNCTSLGSIPADLFSAIDTSSATNTSYIFVGTFDGCTGLTSIPADLFSTIDTSSATNTSGMFSSTFARTGITSIPAGLFSGIDTSSATDTTSMFNETFTGCSSLTSIPADLFSTIDTSSATNTTYMFRYTFYGCSNLGGYIPPTTFPSTIQPGSSSSTSMWSGTFYNTQLLTVCPVGTGQYITGFESDWDGKVSCEPCAGTLPEHASYVAGTCNWTCDSGYLNTGTSCETAKFSVTTTNDATTLSWTMTATGEFYADCGDGGTLTQSGTTTGSTISGNTITRTGTNTTTYTCTWGSAGAHTVRFGGTATGYLDGNVAAISFYISSGGTQAKVASISGSLGAMLPVVNGNTPRFYYAFYNCSNLSSIPAELFRGIDTSSATDTSSMFNMTFNNAGITSIPAGLFSDIDTSSATNTSSMFYYTFQGTGITSIPADLFSDIDTSSATNTRYMFSNTFNNTGITSIPAGLFSGVDTSSATNTSYMFSSTFSNTGITSIPADLFSTIDTSHATNTSGMFMYLFNSCSNLTGYIPPTTFPDTIHPGSSSGSAMWSSAFSGTQLATSCDSFPGMTQYITGFESSWGYSNSNVPTNDGSTRVSCQTCAEAGMPEYADKCHAYCSAMSVLHVGNYQYHLLADRTGVPSPVLALKKNDVVCYLYMEQDDNLNTPGLHIKYDNHTYSPVSLAQPG